MNDNIEFSSLEELYNRVMPALYSKLKEIRKLGYKYINEKDIWNYLAENIWKNKVNLELHELISDILYADNSKINEYVLNKLNRLKKDEDIISIKDDLF